MLVVLEVRQIQRISYQRLPLPARPPDRPLSSSKRARQGSHDCRNVSCRVANVDLFVSSCLWSILLRHIQIYVCHQNVSIQLLGSEDHPNSLR